MGLDDDARVSPTGAAGEDRDRDHEADEHPETSRSRIHGVAAPCRDIAAEPESVFEYTARETRRVAVVSNGSAVLGLGDIGASA